MKLYLYDQKHETILSELPLPKNVDRKTIDRIIAFLDSNGITNKYKQLVLANGYTRECEDGEYYIDFE